MGAVCINRDSLSSEEAKELETLRQQKANWTASSKQQINAGASNNVNAASKVPVAPSIPAAVKPSYMEGDGCPEFLNQMLHFLWPNISNFVNKMILETVQPKIKNALPGPLQCTFSFDPSNCNLGSKPMQFPLMMVEKNVQATGDGRGSCTVLTLKASIEWRSELSVRMNLTGCPVGIENLVMVGNLYFEFVDLIDEPPFFSGVRLFFNNIPEVDMDFHGALAGLNISAIKRAIVEVIQGGIRDQLVLPNRKGFAIVPQADIFRITCPRPNGSLKLIVHKASKLKALDAAGLLSKASSDPYCQISLGPEMQTSETFSKNLNPEFNFSAMFPIANQATQRLKVQLMDCDAGMQRLLGGSDDFLGSIDVNVDDAIAWGSNVQKTFELRDEEGKVGTSGDITVSAEWHPLVLKKIAGDDSGYVFAGIYGGYDLKGDSAGMSYWVKATFKDGTPKAVEKESGKVSPVVPAGTKNPEEVAADAAALKKKVDIMKKNNLSTEDMATVLELEPAVIDPSAKAEKNAEGHARYKVIFNHPFEFPTMAASKSSLKLELMGAATEGKNINKELSYGTIETTMADLSKEPSLTLSKEVKMKHDSMLKIKVQLLYNDKSAQ